MIKYRYRVKYEVALSFNEDSIYVRKINKTWHIKNMWTGRSFVWLIYKYFSSIIQYRDIFLRKREGTEDIKFKIEWYEYRHKGWGKMVILRMGWLRGIWIELLGILHYDAY